MIVYDDLEPSEKIKVYDKGVTSQRSTDRERRKYQLLVGYRTGDMWAPQLDITEALQIGDRAFHQMHRTGEPPITDGHAGLRVVELLEAATQSMPTAAGVRSISNDAGASRHDPLHRSEGPEREHQAASCKPPSRACCDSGQYVLGRRSRGVRARVRSAIAAPSTRWPSTPARARCIWRCSPPASARATKSSPCRSPSSRPSRPSASRRPAGIRRHRSASRHHGPGAARGRDHATDQGDHAGASATASMADMGAILAIADRHGLRGHRGCRPGAWRRASWAPRRRHRRYRLLQLLSRQEPGGLRRRRAWSSPTTRAAEKMRMLRDWGQRDKYNHVVKGFNYRMETLQAAILGVKLPHLEGWTELRRRHAARYTELLAGAGIGLPHEFLRNAARVSRLRGGVGRSRRDAAAVGASRHRDRDPLSGAGATCSRPITISATATATSLLRSGSPGRRCRCRCFLASPDQIDHVVEQLSCLEPVMILLERPAKPVIEGARPGFAPSRMVRLMARRSSAWSWICAGSRPDGGGQRRLRLDGGAAAMAGARWVYAYARDTAYGSCGDLARQTLALARVAGVEDHVEIVTSSPCSVAFSSQIVTNSGNLRPITRTIAPAARCGRLR